MTSRFGPARLGPATAATMACLMALSGCGKEERPRATTTAGAPAGAPASPLAGTSWRLVELQSMEDAQGTARPGDPSALTLRLNADGTAELRLGCNRATGTWSATPGADSSSGQFAFGPLAATQALCPPPDLGAQIGAQAPYVRSYLLRDGRLSLSLLADGGIWVWEPDNGLAPPPARDPAVEQAILKATPSYSSAVLEASGLRDTARYVYARVDLNGDGKEEVFAYPMGSVFCGTGGCTLLVLTPNGNAYRVVNEIPISRPPVVVLEQRSDGWRDFVRLESGGGVPAAYVRHRFSGSKYVEAARQPADAVPAGEQVLSDGVDFRSGIPLVPRD